MAFARAGRARHRAMGPHINPSPPHIKEDARPSALWERFVGTRLSVKQHSSGLENRYSMSSNRRVSRWQIASLRLPRPPGVHSGLAIHLAIRRWVGSLFD